MSKKVRNPKNVVPLRSNKAEILSPQVPILGNDPDSLVGEWRRLQGVMANIQLELNKRQEIINKATTEIQQFQQTGLQINGALQTLTRILSGLGVDPNKYLLPPVPEEEVAIPDSEEDFEEEVPQSVPEEEVNPAPRHRAIRRRFRR